MNLDELKTLIKKGESENIEFKKTTAQQKQGTKAICAMLNHIGGFVFYGINDKGIIQGQEVTKKTLEKLICEHHLISPLPLLEIKTITVSKKLKLSLLKSILNPVYSHIKVVHTCVKVQQLQSCLEKSMKIA